METEEIRELLKDYNIKLKSLTVDSKKI